MIDVEILEIYDQALMCTARTNLIYRSYEAF